MQINALNVSPNFSSRSLEDADCYRKNVSDVMEALNKLNSDDCDCYECKNKRLDLDGFDENGESAKIASDKKNALQIGASVIGAVAITFITGKAVALAANKFFPNMINKAADQATKVTSSVTKGVDDFIANEKTPEIAKKVANKLEAAGSTFTKAVSKSGDKAETLANVAGCVATVTMVPSLVAADNNEDGIKDITQKSVSMYDKCTKNMGALKALLDVAI